MGLRFELPPVNCSRMSLRLLLVSVATWLVASCAAAPKHPFATQLAYPGTTRDEALHLSARGRLAERDRSPRILLGRASPGAGEIELTGSDALVAADEKQAYRLGGIAQLTLARELGIAEDLGVTGATEQ